MKQSSLLTVLVVSPRSWELPCHPCWGGLASDSAQSSVPQVPAELGLGMLYFLSYPASPVTGTKDFGVAVSSAQSSELPKVQFLSKG